MTILQGPDGGEVQRETGRWRRSSRRVTTLLGGATLLLSGMAVMALPDAAGAVANTLYAAPTAQGAGDCSTVVNACALTTALNDATAGTTVALVTSGSKGSSYLGNWVVDASGTTSSSPVTIEPASGVMNPILDGNSGNSTGCPTTSCDGSVLAIGGGVYASVVGVTIQNGVNSVGNGGGIENDGHLTIQGSTISGNSTADGARGCDASGPMCTDNTGGNSGDGGGIENTGTLAITDSTVSLNATGSGGAGGQGNPNNCGTGGTGGKAGNGGGIENTGTLAITASTVAKNSTGSGGDGGPGGCPQSTGGNGGNAGNGGGVQTTNASTVSTSSILSNATGSGGRGADGQQSSGVGGNGGTGGNAGNGGGLDATGALTVATSTVWGNITGPGGKGGNGGNSGTGAFPISGGTGGNAGNGGNGGGLNNGMSTVSSSTISGNASGNGGMGGSGGTGFACGGQMMCYPLIPATAPSGSNGPAGLGSGVDGATLTLLADIVAKQTTGSDCGNASGITDDGYDLDSDNSCGFNGPTDIPGVDPQLGPPTNNGGLTETLLPAFGGPAAFVIPPNTMLDGVLVCPRTDQTGTSAPLTGQSKCTTGAAEPRMPSVPTINAFSTLSFRLGVSGSYTLTTTGFPTPALSKMGTLPTGMTFTDNANGTATLSGTPGPGTEGAWPITVTAANEIGIVHQAIAVHVDQAPQFTSSQKAIFTEGHSGSFTVSTTGSFPLPVKMAAGTAFPLAGLTFVDNGNSTATISGTPTKVVTKAVTIAARNVVLTGTQLSTVTVLPSS